MEQQSERRAYKSRSERPCDTCRGRKIACRIDFQPPCTFCLSRGVDCTFVERPKRRTRSIQMQGRGQEKLKLNTEGMPRSLHRMESIAGITTPTRPDALEEAFFDDQQSQLDIDWDAIPFESDASIVKDSTQELALEQEEQEEQEEFEEAKDSRKRLAARDFTSLHHDYQVSARIVSDAGHLNRQLLRYYGPGARNMDLCQIKIFRTSIAIDNVQDQLNDQAFMVMSSSIAISTDPRQVELQTTALTDSNHIPTKVYGERLAALFFKFVYPAYPILSRTWFLGSGESLVRRIEQLPNSLRYALYATCLPFILHDDMLNATFGMRATSMRAELYDRAWKSIVEETPAPSIGTLQACLLLLQRGPLANFEPPSPVQTCLSAWSIALAKTFGLMHNCMDWSIPLSEKRIRVRWWWAVMIMDQWSTLDQGFSPGASLEDTHVPGIEHPTKQGLLDDKPSLNNYAHFYHLQRLTVILNQVRRTFFTITATEQIGSDLSITLERARPLKSRLQDWKAAFMQDAVLMASDAEPSQNTSLHLAYFVVCMTLFRAMLRPIELDLHSHSHFLNSTAQHAVLTGSVNCARETVEFLVHAVSYTLPWNAFWHSWSQSNFFIASTFYVQLALCCKLCLERSDSSMANEDNMAIPDTSLRLDTTPNQSRSSQTTVKEEAVTLLTQWRKAMRIGAGNGGWGSALMSLALSRIDMLLAETKL